MARRTIDRGDVYHVNLDPTAGSELQGQRAVLVLSTADFNTALRKCFIAPITQGGNVARYGGYAVSLMGTGMKTQGVALVSDLRTMDLITRKANYIEAAPKAVVEDALARLTTLFE